MSKTIWLRSETKGFERRTPLTPVGAKQLINHGAKVVVEKDPDRVIPIEEYQKVGCEIAEEQAWKSEAPSDAFILGLKEIEYEETPLSGKHIYFAHAFKGQDDAKETLSRFSRGDGKLYDLEFLLDENNRRVAAFGYWAGYVGSAISIDYFFHCLTSKDKYPTLKHYQNQKELLDSIRSKMNQTDYRPKGIVIGALGRCGTGALDVFKDLELGHTAWDYEETKKGGPFQEILDHDLFINSVLLTKKIPPFVNKEILNSEQKLKVIGDVSCDPNNENNPIPLYDKITNWTDPFTRLDHNGATVDILAVDNLPSVLPKESSEDFSNQLLSHLVNLISDGPQSVWTKALDIFEEAKKREL